MFGTTPYNQILQSKTAFALELLADAFLNNTKNFNLTILHYSSSWEEVIADISMPATKIGCQNVVLDLEAVIAFDESILNLKPVTMDTYLDQAVKSGRPTTIITLASNVSDGNVQDRNAPYYGNITEVISKIRSVVDVRNETLVKFFAAGFNGMTGDTLEDKNKAYKTEIVALAGGNSSRAIVMSDFNELYKELTEYLHRDRLLCDAQSK